MICLLIQQLMLVKRSFRCWKKKQRPGDQYVMIFDKDRN